MAEVVKLRRENHQLRDTNEFLLLQALNQAIVCAKETTGLIYHLDHGLQYVSIVYNERLAEHGITAVSYTHL